MAEPAQLFAEMATRLGRIAEGEFAGAAVIVAKDGEPIVFLLQDPAPNPAQFWTGVMARVEIAAADAKRAGEEALSPYLGRMR